MVPTTPYCEQSRGVLRTNPTAPWEAEARSVASSADLYFCLCSSSRLGLCHSCRAGVFPLFFPASWIALFYCPFPKPWSYLPLNALSLPQPHCVTCCPSDPAGLGDSGPGEAKVGPGLGDRQ